MACHYTVSQLMLFCLLVPQIQIVVLVWFHPRDLKKMLNCNFKYPVFDSFEVFSTPLRIPFFFKSISYLKLQFLF